MHFGISLICFQKTGSDQTDWMQNNIQMYLQWGKRETYLQQMKLGNISNQINEANHKISELTLFVEYPYVYE